MSRDGWTPVETDKANRWAQPDAWVRHWRVNCRRPWHLRLLRHVSSHASDTGLPGGVPLILAAAVNLLCTLAATMFGLHIVALVCVTAVAGCPVCHRRRHIGQRRGTTTDAARPA